MHVGRIGKLNMFENKKSFRVFVRKTIISISSHFAAVGRLRATARVYVYGGGQTHARERGKNGKDKSVQIIIYRRGKSFMVRVFFFKRKK